MWVASEVAYIVANIRNVVAKLLMYILFNIHIHHTLYTLTLSHSPKKKQIKKNIFRNIFNYNALHTTYQYILSPEIFQKNVNFEIMISNHIKIIILLVIIIQISNKIRNDKSVYMFL